MGLYRESQGSIIVSVNGVNLPITSWATLSGGDAQASSNKTRPGGMGFQLELGGQVTRTDATVTRQWSDELISAFLDLNNAAGITPAYVTFTPMNPNRTVTSQPSFKWSGVLLTVTGPAINAEADAASFLSVVIGLNEIMTSPQN